ncbi:hypothetical protein DICVIV_08013 [Dictyocaulus viviparus]|uniref:Adipocyte plasma membrane-associated protein n=1 Tax=Dictyocaulus viviparus TaxID=29172 RepID=A0A0D8XN18_DICVI|nr:hypothetical protein DICVIV_08013 [Dictyocaulus viviparus]
MTHYRYYPDSKSFDVFIDNLPGYPDNIRLGSNGTLWVPLPAIRSEYDNWFAVRPKLRSLLTMLLSSHSIHYFAQWMAPKYGFVLKMDSESGMLLESLHDRTGHISDVTVAVEDGHGNLLMGSDTQYYIARLKL